MEKVFKYYMLNTYGKIVIIYFSLFLSMSRKSIQWLYLTLMEKFSDPLIQWQHPFASFRKRENLIYFILLKATRPTTFCFVDMMFMSSTTVYIFISTEFEALIKETFSWDLGVLLSCCWWLLWQIKLNQDNNIIQHRGDNLNDYINKFQS